MNPLFTLVIIVAYIVLLYVVSRISSKNATAESFYNAKRKAPWYLVSYGMIGVAISGITFISVPGEVANSGFTYFQIVIGYSLGLVVVALVLLPLFYKLQLVSIYSYLEDRFGNYTHKTGAGLFLLAHMLGAAFRLYLMAYVLQLIIFDALGIPFAVTVFVTLALIWLYTHKGGIQTVIFTDVLQTTFLLLAAVIGIWAVANKLNLSLLDIQEKVWNSSYARIFEWSWQSPDNFFKLVITGMLLTVVTNGLDQAIMQKHLACRNIRDAQKNMFMLSGVLLLVNILFLFLGGALAYLAMESNISMPEQTDNLFPLLATNHLGMLAGVAFVIGIAAAAYSSADTSITGLTTAFCVDFLGYQKHKKDNPFIRKMVHLGFSVMIFIFIIAFKALNNESIISVFIKVLGYAYGPLLALFVFGMADNKIIHDKWVPWPCIASPIIAYVLDRNSEYWFGYQFSYETIFISAAVTLLGLYFISVFSKGKIKR